MTENYTDPREKYEATSPVGTALKWGLIGGFAMILISLIFHLADVSPTGAIQYLLYVFIIGALVLGILDHKKNELDGYITFGRALGTATLVALFTSLIYAVYIFVFISFIDTTYLDEVMVRIREGLEEEGMSDTEIDQAMHFFRLMNNPLLMTIGTFIANFAIGFISSLVAAAITKNESLK